MVTIVQRDLVPEDYQDMLKTEAHHNHPIVLVDGVLRWQADPFVCELYEAIGLNEIVHQFYKNGLNKNSEVWRELYRKMGYSLSGYWEIFYWEVNNESAGEYKPPTPTPSKAMDSIPAYPYVCSFQARFIQDVLEVVGEFETYINSNRVRCQYQLSLLQHIPAGTTSTDTLVEIRLEKPLTDVIEKILRKQKESIIMVQTLRPVALTENSFERDYTKE
jgi:hypothetical protein